MGGSSEDGATQGNARIGLHCAVAACHIGTMVGPETGFFEAGYLFIMKWIDKLRNSNKHHSHSGRYTTMIHKHEASLGF